MHPVLFRIGDFEVLSYSAALALAFAVGIAVAYFRARRRGLDPSPVLDLGLLILVASLVGARSLWVLTHLESFRGSDAGALAMWSPFHGEGPARVAGLSMLGGVGFATGAALLYLAWRRLPVLAYADVLAPSVLLGEGITRIGCFLNGCCHGVACAWPWAVRFPAGSPAAQLFPDVAIHPAQLYASLFGFAGFAALVALARRSRREGLVFFAFLALAGAGRLVLELFRYSEPRAPWIEALGLPGTSNQLVALVFLVAGIAGMVAGTGRRAAPRR